MGATNFEDFGPRDVVDVQRAYNDACRSAEFEYGHNGYNGTISTTNGVKVFEYEPSTLAAAYAIMSDELDNLNKWEHCGAVALAKDDGSFDRWFFFGWAAM